MATPSGRFGTRSTPTRGNLDDPHLWERVRLLGLDLARFDADRRSQAVNERVRADFESGIHAGVAGTPTAFIGHERAIGGVPAALKAHAAL